MAKKKILFIIGSVNQTSQMHQISELLPEYDCYFSQFYGNHPVVRAMINMGTMENTILSGHFKKTSEDYLAKHGLKNDYRGLVYKQHYDLAVICNDLIMPKEVTSTKMIWVQEGMVDPVTLWSKIVKAIKIPRYFAMGTSLNGSSNLYHIGCVASEGYKNFFTKMGVDRDKLTVTGIPNFDDAKQYLDNDFEHKDYVMVATSDIRETFRWENRKKFIKEAVKIANGRQLLFKLHPNEKYDRALKEIRECAPPNALVYQKGNTNEMIANCQELVTQYSTVVYMGIALGKEVHSYFDVEELKQQCPIQNDGQSAQNIADICRGFIEFDGTGPAFLKKHQEELKQEMKGNYKQLECTKAETPIHV